MEQDFLSKIFHEKQEGALCAQHCLNSLLQGPYFTAVDLAELAHQCDLKEQAAIAEGFDSGELAKYIAEGSRNMDDTGYFSVQVLSQALEAFQLQIVPIGSMEMKETKENPLREQAFILNQGSHWLTLRKFGNTVWFNLNSTLPQPEVISPVYLRMLLQQLQLEGYSVFVIKGQLFPSPADELAVILGSKYHDSEDLVRHLRDLTKNSGKKPVAQEPPKPVEYPKTEDAESIRLKRLMRFQ